MREQLAPDALDTARDLFRANRPREAAALLVKFLQLHPRDERAWHLLSFVLSDPERQSYALQRVLKINPGNRAARAQLARLVAAAPPHVHPSEGCLAEGTAAEGDGRRVPYASSAVAAAAPAPVVDRQGAAVGARVAAFFQHASRQRLARGRAESVAAGRRSTSSWLARYVTVKSGMLLLTVAAGLFFATVLINYGGFVDKIFEDRINHALMGIGYSMSGAPPEEVAAALEQAGAAMTEAYGLNDPFLLRCFRWFVRGITLQWGETERIQTSARDNSVRAVIMERLPRSLLLLGAGNLAVFIGSLFLALTLSKRYGSLVDRAIVGLSPLSAAPTWVHGILLTVIFAAELRLLPFGGMFDEAPPALPIGYVWVVAKHMILPVAAIFMATFFQSVYAWRTFFVLHSQEDYVEMAEAKGLPARMVERRYILQPTLPFIITSFALIVITSWQGLLVLETFFHWPGIGDLFIQAVQRLDRPVLVGLIVIFAYLLALTVLLLDLIYALVDPRIRIGGRNGAAPRRLRLLRMRRRGDGGRSQARHAGTAVRTRPKQPWWQAPRLLLPLRKESRWRDWRANPGHFAGGLRRTARGLASGLRILVRYPSALLGVALIVALVSLAAYAIVAVPLEEAIRLGRVARTDWYEAPSYAQPAWVNFFRKHDLPPSIVMESGDAAVTRTVEVVSEDMTRVTLSFPFDYPYGALPQDILVFLESKVRQKRTSATLTWHTPDGREIRIANRSLAGSAETYYLSADTRFGRKVGEQDPVEVLFLPPGSADGRPLQGRYEFEIEALLFEEDASFDARVVIEGKVYGVAGTDHRGRDLIVPLLWGAPVALVFGLLGGAGTAILSLVIAAAGTWFGGWVDELVQRLTEVNMILPTLPIAIMVYLAYSKSVWVVLGAMVLLSIFGSTIKNYRAIILQVKESAYVEAARVYGASDRRIVLRYLVPKILPVLVPNLVILIPGYVFLEATLAYLGISDPVLPTWGKVVYDALHNGAFNGHYYWVLEPIGLLLATGLAFALLGFALDRILNPRLRSL